MSTYRIADQWDSGTYGSEVAEYFLTAYEYTDREGGAVAYDTTMDLRNNAIGRHIGRLIYKDVVEGRIPPSQANVAIQNALLNELLIGGLWIVPENGLKAGMIIRSNGESIYPLS